MVAHGKDLSRFSGEASGETLKITFRPKLPWESKFFSSIEASMEDTNNTFTPKRRMEKVSAELPPEKEMGISLKKLSGCFAG